MNAGIGILMLSVVIILLFNYVLWNNLSQSDKNQKKRNKVLLLVNGSILSWLVYLTIISKIGVFESTSMPPKFPLFVFLPFFIFCLVFYLKMKSSEVLEQISITASIYLQTFRIVVEILLYLCFAQGILTELATFSGYNLDIIMGISAPFVGYAVFKNRLSNGLLRVWSVVGILMIMFVGFIVATSLYAPHIWGSAVQLTPFEFVRMPYLLVGGFLAPLGIFLHVVTLTQLQSKKLKLI